MRYLTVELRKRKSESLKQANPNHDGHAFRGHHHTEEAKVRMSNARKGKPCPWVNAALKGKPRPQEVKDKISASLRRRPNGRLGTHHSEETKGKISASNRGRRWSEDARARLLAKGGNRTMLGKHHSEATKAKMRAHWQDPEFVAQHIQAQNIKPNKAELQLQSILDKYFPREWRFVGDGQLIIGGKMPDFVNINGKKQFIELFGTYWHSLFDMAERKEHFRQYGFQTMVIWDDELKDEQRLVKNLKRALRKCKSSV